MWPFSDCRRSHRILRVKSRPPLASQQWTERILVQAHLGWRSRVIVDRQHVKTARALAHLTLAESLCRAHPTGCLSVVTLNSGNAGKASVFTVRVRTSTNAASRRRTRSDRFRPSPRTACNFAPQAHSRAAANTNTHRSRPECQSCGAAIFRQRAPARAQDRLLVRRRRRRANLPATLTARSRIQAQTKQACDAPRASIIAELSTCKVNKNNDDRRSRSATGFASNFSLTSFLLRGCSLPGSSPRSRPAPRR
jgi:hypothetical protein